MFIYIFLDYAIGNRHYQLLIIFCFDLKLSMNTVFSIQGYGSQSRPLLAQMLQPINYFFR